MSKETLSFVTPPAEKLQNFFGVFLQFQIGVDTKGEVGKPFPQEDELREKSARLAELDALLNIDGGHRQEEQAIAKCARPSVLDGLKRPAQPGPDRKMSKAVGQEL